LTVDIAPGSSFMAQAMPDMTEAEYHKLSQLIYKVSGISLRDSKQALLTSRLAGIFAQSGWKNFTEYYNALISDKSGMGVAVLVDKITTNHTYFMREPAHFAFFRDTVLPYLKKTVLDRDMRVWCAACSTGEESYTLAMILDEFLGVEKSRWDSRVLATDLSEKVLVDAARGVYSRERVEPLPVLWKQRYFRPLPDGNFEIGDHLKKEVIYRRFNLIEPIYPFRKKFHVIFCRNVMIYFDSDTRNTIINKLYDMTEPGGYLFIGHSEAIDRSKSNYKYVLPAVYRKM
jgi:chemotaxis protein methyltransferase CheR